MASKKTEPYKNIVIYNHNSNGQAFDIIYDFLFYNSNENSKQLFNQINLKTGNKMKTETRTYVYTIYVFCDKMLLWYKDNGYYYHSFQQVYKTGECKEIFLQKVNVYDWGDKTLTYGCGMGMFRTRDSKTILNIMDSQVTEFKDQVADRPKMFHPILGYTMYPEYSEKFAKYYQEFQETLYLEEKIVPQNIEQKKEIKELTEEQKVENFQKEFIQNLYIQKKPKVNQTFLKQVIESLPNIESLDQLQKLDEEYIPFIVEELAKQPQLLKGKKSEFFTHKVDQYLGFSKEAKSELKEIVNEFLQEIKQQQTQSGFEKLELQNQKLENEMKQLKLIMQQSYESHQDEKNKQVEKQIS